MKQAQAALEFLMTYGWAMLVVIVMIGAFSYYNGYLPMVTPSKCIMDTPFACASYKVFAPALPGDNGTVALGIVPLKGLDYVNVSVDCARNGLMVPSTVMQIYIPESIRLNTTMLYFSCPVNGRVYRGDIYITYRLYNQVVMHTIKGSITSPIE